MTAETGPDVDHLRETLVERRQIYAGRLLTVFEDEVGLPDGSVARREIVSHPGAVAVVALADEERVVLVRQWRHALGGAIWEIPAGTRDKDEPVAATAPRELAEETGFRARRWSSLGAACVSPGYSRELISFFLAEGLVAGPTDLDRDERVDVMLAGPAEIADLVRRGAVDCKTLAGLALAGRLPHLIPSPG
ncbi:MAG TPA: NUDIX hydrolase [Candidatus Dormibacteraeota bacterium]